MRSSHFRLLAMQSADCISVLKDHGRNLTPIEVIQAAQIVLDGIELDPASDEIANYTVNAQRFYSVEQDGFAQPWTAKTVWLNPPGRTRSKGKSVDGSAWGKKLLREYLAGTIHHAIYLCYRGGSVGSVGMMVTHGLTCLTAAGAESSAINGSGRLSFEKIVGSNRVPGVSNTQSSVIFLLSQCPDVRRRFIQEFAQFGQIVVPVMAA